MEEIQSVVANDDSQASWSELLEEPHNRGYSFFPFSSFCWFEVRTAIL